MMEQVCTSPVGAGWIISTLRDDTFTLVGQKKGAMFATTRFW
jgi:hypothetical protein